MIYTIEELNDIVVALQNLTNEMNTIIKSLPAVYAAKLQMKQLDTIRGAQIIELDKKIQEIKDESTAPPSTGPVYVPKIQWNQLDNIRAGQIQELKQTLDTLAGRVTEIEAHLPTT